jgi:hypothetical protein
MNAATVVVRAGQIWAPKTRTGMGFNVRIICVQENGRVQLRRTGQGMFGGAFPLRYVKLERFGGDKMGQYRLIADVL